MKRFFILLFAVLASACSPLSVLNGISPSTGYMTHQDIAYGKLPKQRLDIYTPKKSEHAPVIVFFHGGSWQTGTKDQYRFVAQSLTSQGFITVIPDTRLYPEVKYPDFLHDSAKAVTWVRDHIGSYGGDNANIFTMGHSSGAYSAVMLALDPEYLQSEGGDIDMLRGVIGLAGPYDFLPLKDKDVKAVFSPANKNLELTQPVHYVSGKHPPMLLLHGTDDDTVLPRNTRHLAYALHKNGNQAKTIYYQGLGHAGILMALSGGFKGKAPVIRDISRFVRHEREE
jgi:acetyl esterase/lipase